jgi:hypothetical protein
MMMVMVVVVVMVPAPPPPAVVMMVVMVNYYHLSHFCSISGWCSREPRVVGLQGRQSIWHWLKEVAIGGRRRGLGHCRSGGL